MNDTPTDTATMHIHLLPYLHIIIYEIRESVLAAGNTAPNPYEIPTSVIGVAWPLIETHT